MPRNQWPLTRRWWRNTGRPAPPVPPVWRLPSLSGMTATDRTNLKVLIAEDCDDSAASLAYLLRADGHDVRVACDGPSAVAETIRDPPDVVILDIGLPGMDGFEVARQIVTGHADSGPLLIAL